jgi:hypothetical protein
MVLLLMLLLLISMIRQYHFKLPFKLNFPSIRIIKIPIQSFNKLNKLNILCSRLIMTQRESILDFNKSELLLRPTDIPLQRINFPFKIYILLLLCQLLLLLLICRLLMLMLQSSLLTLLLSFVHASLVLRVGLLLMLLS